MFVDYEGNILGLNMIQDRYGMKIWSNIEPRVHSYKRKMMIIIYKKTKKLVIMLNTYFSPVHIKLYYFPIKISCKLCICPNH